MRSKFLCTEKLGGLVFAATVLIGCGNLGPEDGQIEVNSIEQEIRNGTEDTEHTAVVHVNLGSPNCTGTFITKRHVVLANHCFGCGAGDCCPGGASDCAWTGTVYDGLLPFSGNTYTVDRLFLVPTADWNLGDGGPPDVAMVRVTSDFVGEPMDVMGPTKMPTGDNIDDYTDEIVTIVGYSDDFQPDGRRRQGQTRVTGVDIFGHKRAYYTDGSATSQSGCLGDSGGPTLFTNGYGRQEVGGVLSNSDCGLHYWSDYAYIPHGWLDDVICGDGWEFLTGRGQGAVTASSFELVRITPTGAVCRLKDSFSSWITMLQPGGHIERYGGTGTSDTHESWWLIDDNWHTRQIAMTWEGIYQRHDNGYVWKWNGGFRNWILKDSYYDTGKDMVTTHGGVYQIRSNGRIYQCNNSGWTTCYNGTWTLWDDNWASEIIEVSNLGLFQMHYNGGVWKHDGGFRLWTQLNSNSYNERITATNTQLFRYYDYAGYTWIYYWSGTGTSWYTADYSTVTTQVLAHGNDLYKVNVSGSVYRWLGSTRSWVSLGGEVTSTVGLYGSEATLP